MCSGRSLGPAGCGQLAKMFETGAPAALGVTDSRRDTPAADGLPTYLAVTILDPSGMSLDSAGPGDRASAGWQGLQCGSGATVAPPTAVKARIEPSKVL